MKICPYETDDMCKIIRTTPEAQVVKQNLINFSAKQVTNSKSQISRCKAALRNINTDTLNMHKQIFTVVCGCLNVFVIVCVCVQKIVFPCVMHWTVVYHSWLSICKKV